MIPVEDRAERAANRVVVSRKVGDVRMALTGANDLLPADRRIECLPSIEQCRETVVRLAKRLGTDVAHANGVYSRGGVSATPLALPELLDVLIERVSLSNRVGEAAE